MALIEYKLDNNSVDFKLELARVGAQGRNAEDGIDGVDANIVLEDDKIPNSYLLPPELSSSNW